MYTLNTVKSNILGRGGGREERREKREEGGEKGETRGEERERGEKKDDHPNPPLTSVSSCCVIARSLDGWWLLFTILLWDK